MKNALLVTTALLLNYSANAYANECGIPYKEANISIIADTLASKVMGKHLIDFEKPTPIKNRKMPWTLSEQEDVREFIEDILRKNNKATRDGQTKLAIESKELASDRIGWWEDTTGTYVVYNPNEQECGTAFRPPSGKEYYDNET